MVFSIVEPFLQLTCCGRLLLFIIAVFVRFALQPESRMCEQLLPGEAEGHYCNRNIEIRKDGYKQIR
jgi:hypothetical protein